MKVRRAISGSTVKCALVAMLILSPLVSVSIQAQPDEPFFDIHIAVTAGIQKYEDVAEVLRGNLEKIGIRAEVESVEWVTLLSRARRAAAEELQSFAQGGFDIFMVYLSGGAFEPSGLARYFHSKARGSFNVWNYYDPEQDRILDLADSKLTIEGRQFFVWEASKVLYEELPVIPFNYPRAAYIFQQGWEGFEPYWGNQTVLGSLWRMTYEGEPAERLIVADPLDIRSPNPLFDWTSGFSQKLGPHVFSPLIKLDEGQRPEPDLATSWESSGDGRTWTIYLRDDVYWHDGVKFTSADVKFTFEARMDPATGAERHSKFLIIESVEAPDDYTVIVRLKEPYAPFLFEIAGPKIAPAHVFEGLSHEELANSPYTTGEKVIPGTGPMQLVEWRPGEFIHLKANPNYFKGEPSVGEIIWRLIPSPATALAALEAGEVDGLGSHYAYTAEIPMLEADPGFTVEKYNTLDTEVFGINNFHPILGNKWVRKAISLAIPRKEICEKLVFGLCTPASQFLGPWSWGHNPGLEEIEYDLEKARGYLEIAGYSQ